MANAIKQGGNMVKKSKFKGKTVFQCGICGLNYLEKETAAQCEAFCRTHPNMCDPFISAKAME